MSDAENLTWDAFLTLVSGFLGRDRGELSRSTHLFDELCVDSLGVFSLGMHLMDAYGIRVPLAEVSNLATVGDLFDVLHRHRDPR